MAVKVVCDAGKNSGCEMPMPLRACTTTPEIPLPATRIVQNAGFRTSDDDHMLSPEVWYLGHVVADRGRS
jgi:hypothetical protein